MPVPSVLADLNVNAAANSPLGTELVGTNLDNYIRAHAAIIKQFTEDLANGTDAAKGDALFFVKQPFAGSKARSGHEKFQDFLTALDADLVTGDGIADDSAGIQAFIDANKGKTLFFPGGKNYLAAGIRLDGSTYNNTRLIFYGTFKLKPSAGATNNDGAWNGLIIRDCEGVHVDGFFDGNRTAQPNNEFINVIALAGARKFSSSYINIKEVRGDGIYINEKEWLTSPTARTSEVSFGSIVGTNSASDGRNLVSVISGKNITFGSILSDNIGGFVGGIWEPGGFDIESDQTWHEVRNITVGSLTTRGQGTSNCAIQGMPTSFVDGVTIQNYTNESTATSTEADEFSNVTQSSHHLLLIRHAKNIKVSGVASHTVSYGSGVTIINSDSINVDMKVTQCRYAAQIGVDTADTAGNGVRFSQINVRGERIGRDGFRVGKVEDCDISGDVFNPVTTFYSNRFGVLSIRSGGAGSTTQNNIRFSVNVKPSVNWTRAYRNDATLPVTYSGCELKDCDLSSFSLTNAIDNTDMRRTNVRGVNDQATIPDVGTWKAGDFVYSRPFNFPGGGKILLGWARATNGSAHLLDTDWFRFFGTNS